MPAARCAGCRLQDTCVSEAAGPDGFERHNRQADDQAAVARLTQQIEKIIADGRSTPGEPQKNDVPVKLWKQGRTAAKVP